MGRRPRTVSRSARSAVVIGLGLVVGVSLLATPAHALPNGTGPASPGKTQGPVANFTAAVNRLVELVGLAGGGILALVWARVALSWFSNDVTKKIQAKDRARDALIGTLLFVAAVSGLIYGLAHWVVTGA
jgi:hypothetical protein